MPVVAPEIRLIRSFRTTALGAVVWWGVTIAANSTGCAMKPKTATEHLADDQYRLKCQTPLPQCLEEAERLCAGNRYTVVSAVDEHDYLGPQGSTSEHQVRASEAVVHCGTRGRSIWGSSASASAAVPSSEAASASPGSTTASGAATPRVCVPGATQTCVGPGACRGGQSCAPDGSGFSRCDCGGLGATDAGGGVGAAPQPQPSSVQAPPLPSPPPPLPSP
jgi:hypothetical protein